MKEREKLREYHSQIRKKNREDMILKLNAENSSSGPIIQKLT